MLALFTIIHPLVDACSVGVLVAGGMSLERIIVYNAAAFALQLPFGMAMDVFPRLNRICFFTGTGLTVASAAAAAIFGSVGWGVLLAAGVGNALFHLIAGKHVLETHNGRPGPAGLFISTGALGLAAGLMWTPVAPGTCLFVFASALAVFTSLAALKEWERRRPVEAAGLVHPGAASNGKKVLCAVLSLALLTSLFFLTAWRSWAGLLANARSEGACVAVMITGAVAVLAGKIAGGYAAERAGRWIVTAFSVAGSAALVFLCEPSMAVLWIGLLFVSQLATGPVLSLIFDRTGRRGGAAFGLNCLGLFTGSIV